MRPQITFTADDDATTVTESVADTCAKPAATDATITINATNADATIPAVHNEPIQRDGPSNSQGIEVITKGVQQGYQEGQRKG